MEGWHEHRRAAQPGGPHSSAPQAVPVPMTDSGRVLRSARLSARWLNGGFLMRFSPSAVNSHVDPGPLLGERLAGPDRERRPTVERRRSARRPGETTGANLPSGCNIIGVKIGELARLGDVNPKTIRYYESIGLLPAPARTHSGYRDYDDSFLDRLTFIRTAQRLGLTLDEVKEILSFRERGEAPCAYVRGLLGAQLDSIDRRIRELEELRAQLTELAAKADRLPEVGGTCRLIEHVRQKAAAAGRSGEG